ncbi:unnamed protein product [Danaus chrysippus]|uniref:(African queen) hypothetical protein n=1 Tax=Danaus chrysippus TaxID=151541 RepID=A0A8J2QJX0_9NEOP|nr:unnamed protein product [Danaus chrysippus]
MTIQNNYQTNHEVNHVNVDDSRYGIYRRPIKVGSKRFSYNHITKNKHDVPKKGQEDNNNIEDHKPKRMDWNDYQRLDVIHSFLDELEYDYPSICTVGTIGLSREDRNLKILKVSNSDAHNPAVWLDAGIHAREWIAPAVATYIANHIVRNFGSLPSSITNKDWYFHPVVNPDGYEYSHTVDRMWRKNKAYVGGKLVGVDLNRNFSFGWGGKGSSEIPTSVFYRGPEPFSEPESCAVRDVLLYSGIPFKVYITLHSYGQIILFPFAYKDELCPDYVRLLEGATVMSKAIHESSGNTYKVGLSRDVMYGAAGTSNDFSYGVAKIPYCYLLELRMAVNQVWEIKFTHEGQRYFVKTLDTAGAINIWKEERSTMDIMVESPHAAQVAGLLNERDIPYSIAISDVKTLIEREQGNTLKKNLNTKGAMDWKSYHRLDVIYSFMDDLAAQYPYLCTVNVIGKSVEGRDLRMLKVSNGNENNMGVWIDGSIHPREWVSTAVVTYFADRLVRTFQEQPDSVTNKDWYILPVLNPDGYEYTHTHDRMWRKNRNRYGECVGVDLNRNFSYGWGEKGEEGSSEDPGNIFYRGPKPFSEPETAALKRVILDESAKFGVFLSFHSYGEVIIFPWGYTADPCPDYVELLEGGTAMAKAIFDTSGHTYKVGSTKDLMYFAAGTSTDWSYAVANIKYSYMIELRGKQHRFLLPKEHIIETATEVMNGVLRLMDFVDRRCRSTQACVCPK